MKKITLFVKKYVPKFSIVLYVLFVFSVAVHITAIFFEGFAEFFNNTVAAVFRFIFAKFTGWFTFSFAEIVIILLPLIIFVLVYFGIKSLKCGKRRGLRYLFGFFSFITLLYSEFVFTFACGYRGYSLEKKLSFEITEVSSEELNYALVSVIEELNVLSERIEYGKDGFSEIPYDFNELNDKLNAEYKNFSEKYGIVQNMSSKVKPILLSKPMTYTHISGVYTFFTGEANVNTNYPEYNLPYTMAHEIAHQRGIAPENEANFVAFLVCIESSDIYIQYSAYLNMFEYLSNALYYADKTLYKETISTVNKAVINELVAYGDFFDKYRDNIVADISGAVNNNYLISQGQNQGTRSYGLVVDFAVAYYKDIRSEVDR